MYFLDNLLAKNENYLTFRQEKKIPNIIITNETIGKTMIFIVIIADSLSIFLSFIFIILFIAL